MRIGHALVVFTSPTFFEMGDWGSPGYKAVASSSSNAFWEAENSNLMKKLFDEIVFDNDNNLKWNKATIIKRQDKGGGAIVKHKEKY